jgi:hypothetical protein
VDFLDRIQSGFDKLVLKNEKKEEFMHNSIRIVLIVIIGFAMTLGEGCVTAKVWISNPAVQTAGNPYYDAKIEPLKGGNKFFVSFRLVVTNRTDKNLEVDWNKTRYIYNGRTHGVFVFDGIRPEDIKNLTIPADSIVKGHIFSKVISPFKLLARAPIKDRYTDKPVIIPGIMPNGKNGIHLVVRQNGKEIIEKMSVNVQEKEAQ